jgi:3-oxoadipate enol-lactonase
MVLYDKRGHGLSDVGDMPYSMDLHVADLAGLLDLLSVKQAIICGLSVGGLIAQGLYAARPDLVLALALCDTAHKIGTADLWNTRIAAIEQNGIASITDSILERWFTPAFRRPENNALLGYRNMLIRQPMDGYIATCVALREADLTAFAPLIRVPTICIVGDQDGSASPRLVADFAKTIPEARFEVIADCGHIPSIEQPERLVGIMRAFISLAATEAVSYVSH